MAFKLHIDSIINDYKEKGGETKFFDSLKQILKYAESDDNLKSFEHLAYLLATAKAESDYSLTRWEADYLCEGVGIPYKGKPCQKALNYYKSTQGGKNNYYDLGVDSEGLPYFGRGLIQLTGKSNYKVYGDIIGKDLINNSSLALEPKNSYLIASAYMNKKRGESNNSTFDWVDKKDFTQARKSVNGGTSSLNLVNDVYKFWLPILKKNGKVLGVNSRTKKIIGVGVVLATVGITGIILYYALKKTNKLPKFLQKINL